MSVVLRLEWQTAISQSERADETPLLSTALFIRQTRTIFFRRTLVQWRGQVDRARVREKNVPNTWASPHFRRTSRQWAGHCLSGNTLISLAFGCSCRNDRVVICSLASFTLFCFFCCQDILLHFILSPSFSLSLSLSLSLFFFFFLGGGGRGEAEGKGVNHEREHYFQRCLQWIRASTLWMCSDVHRETWKRTAPVIQYLINVDLTRAWRVATGILYEARVQTGEFPLCNETRCHLGHVRMWPQMGWCWC